MDLIKNVWQTTHLPSANDTSHYFYEIRERPAVAINDGNMLHDCNNPAPNRNKHCDKIMTTMASVGNHQRFKDWLLQEMGKREWSQADLARYADLNRAVINKLLNGQSNPRPTTLEAIARAFKMPVESIYRIAGLLPEVSASDGFIEEMLHNIKKIRNPRRKETALRLIKVLVAEEEEEQKKS